MASLVALGVSLAALVACGPNCQNTCDQIYNVCSIDKPGQTKDELLRDCNNECETALKNSAVEPGLENYNPNTPRNSSQSINMADLNETQIVEWMDCVWFQAPDGTPEQCQTINPTSGFCAPI